MATAFITWGYSLHHMGLQPPSHGVTASITWGFSLHQHLLAQREMQQAPAGRLELEVGHFPVDSLLLLRPLLLTSALLPGQLHLHGQRR